MRKRSRSREYALQILYQTEVKKDPQIHIEEFWRQVEANNETVDLYFDEIKEFAGRLVNLVNDKKEIIDQTISESAEHWELGRMAIVDRNILRIGTCEILYCEDVPPKVAINESIELAKKYGDDETSKFVNGILDQVAKKHAA